MEKDIQHGKIKFINYKREYGIIKGIIGVELPFYKNCLSNCEIENLKDSMPVQFRVQKATENKHIVAFDVTVIVTQAQQNAYNEEMQKHIEKSTENQENRATE